MNIIEKIKDKLTWVDKLCVMLVALTLIGALLSRIGFQLIGNTICGICLGVVVVAIVYFACKVVTTKRREKDECES